MHIHQAGALLGLAIIVGCGWLIKKTFDWLDNWLDKKFPPKSGVKNSFTPMSDYQLKQAVAKEAEENYRQAEYRVRDLEHEIEQMKQQSHDTEKLRALEISLVVERNSLRRCAEAHQKALDDAM